MTTEKKQMFTRRITQANRTQLVVIVYEMLLVYLEDAIHAYEADNKQEYAISEQLNHIFPTSAADALELSNGGHILMSDYCPAFTSYQEMYDHHSRIEQNPYR